MQFRQSPITVRVSIDPAPSSNRVFNVPNLCASVPLWFNLFGFVLASFKKKIAAKAHGSSGDDFLPTRSVYFS